MNTEQEASNTSLFFLLPTHLCTDTHGIGAKVMPKFETWHTDRGMQESLNHSGLNLIRQCETLGD